ncbi:MAG TPA: ABC transporter permease, partial [Candidatus Synoicihabitans sp.]|nr:ABC transporter permease [Candidatus Synoicihabitans sp.]
MNRIRGWWKRVERSLRPRRFEAEMAEEMRAHQEWEAAALRTRGLDAASARRQAALDFGNVDALQEQVRDGRFARLVHEFISDSRYALRQLRRAPGFAAVAVTTLGLGIGASTAMLSALDGVMFRPMPYPDPDRIMLLFEVVPSSGINNASGGAFVDWRTHQTSFEGISLTSKLSRNVRYGSALERLGGTEVTHEFFDVLGVKPVLGRTFLPSEDQPGGDNRVVVVTEDFWRTRFGRSDDVLGATLVLDEVPHTVVGVVPRDFIEPETQFFIPAVAQLSPEGKYSRNFHWAMVVGRLRPGVTAAQAEAELKAIKQRLDPEYPVWKQEWSVAVRAPRPLIAERTAPIALALVGAVTLVLLIACANVA